MIDENFNRDFRIDELIKKREVFSNDASKIKRYRFKLKEILKDGRRFRSRAEFGLEDTICALLQTYHIKREAWFGGTIIRFNEKKIQNIWDLRFLTKKTKNLRYLKLYSGK